MVADRVEMKGDSSEIADTHTLGYSLILYPLSFYQGGHEWYYERVYLSGSRAASLSPSPPQPPQSLTSVVLVM